MKRMSKIVILSLIVFSLGVVATHYFMSNRATPSRSWAPSRDLAVANRAARAPQPMAAIPFVDEPTVRASPNEPTRFQLESAPPASPPTQRPVASGRIRGFTGQSQPPQLSRLRFASDRFGNQSAADQVVADAQPPEFGSFAPATAQPRFEPRRRPETRRFDTAQPVAPSLGQPVVLASNWQALPALPSRSEPQPPSTLSSGPVANAAPMESIELATEAAYVIHVARKLNTTQNATTSSQFVYDGKVVNLVQHTSVAAPSALKIYANSVNVEHTADGLRLSCEGKVSVLATQSLIRGQQLTYAEGEFRVEETELLTTDAKIQCAESTFAFPIGTIRIEAIPKVEEPNVAEAHDKGRIVPLPNQPEEPQAEDVPAPARARLDEPSLPTPTFPELEDVD